MDKKKKEEEKQCALDIHSPETFNEPMQNYTAGLSSITVCTKKFTYIISLDLGKSPLKESICHCLHFTGKESEALTGPATCGYIQIPGVKVES